MSARAAVEREQVLRAAVDLADREGLEALNMRRLAAELGVTPMALYTHFSSKEALLDGLLDAARSEVQLDSSEGRDWGERIKVILRSWRRAGVKHPWFPPLSVRRQPSTLPALRIIEQLLATLRQGGLDERTVALAYRALAGYVLGYLSLESRGFFPGGEGEQAALPVQAVIGNQFRHLLQVAPHLIEWDRDAEFEVGLDLILDGLRHRVAGQE